MFKKIAISICVLLSAFNQIHSVAQTWSKVGNSIFNDNDTTPGGIVYVLKEIDSNLFVGGGFHNIGLLRVNSIATWDGTKWDSLNSAITGSVYDVGIFNNDIYIGGAFGANGIHNGCIAKWNGIDWLMLGSGLPDNSSYIRSIIGYNNYLYIGGSITSNNILKWDGVNLTSVGGGVWGNFSHVQALTEYDGELIVGGVFCYAGNKTIFNIARWDGINWFDLDTGTASVVNALVVDTINNFLYVGGGFSSVGGDNGISTPCIARWDGYQWDSLAEGLPYCDVMSLCMYHKKLFAGACSENGNSSDIILSKWDSKNWTKIEGPNDAVEAMGVYNDELYVGGGFRMIGQDTMIGIARYYEPPDTTCDYLQAIIEPRNLILKTLDSTTVHFYNNIIHGSSWHWDFGDGATDSIRMPIHTYSSPGVYNVSVIVVYQNCTDTAYTTVTIVDNTGIKDNDSNKEYLDQNIPNPFNQTSVIPYYVPQGNIGVLEVTDASGNEIKEFKLQQGKNELQISLAEFKTGTYLYSILINGEKKKTLKMILKKD
jgi:hypothetical protein